MGVSIYIATNKQTEFPDNANYQPIQVGWDGNGRPFSDLNDAMGVSIADKNPFYCELTALYWLWKNGTLDDYVGLCHYRRFFYLKGYPGGLARKMARSLSDIREWIDVSEIGESLQHADIILPVAGTCLNSMEQEYKEHHRPNDFDVMKEVLLELYPEYEATMRKVFSRRYIYFFNMFITSKKIFCDYMEWLFNILFEVEKRIHIPYDDLYQRRVFGFLAERLLNVYVEHHEMRVQEVPLIYIENEHEDYPDQYRNVKYYVKRFSPVGLKGIRDFVKGK